MVIRREDRVADVLGRDEGLVEVFASMSPAFARLRNTVMRKVMARLVTVDEAGRIAGVDPDRLVDRLNRAVRSSDAPGGDEAEEAASRPPEPQGGGSSELRPCPREIEALEAAHVVRLDVREDLREGREPFSRIMGARRGVPAGGALVVRATFEPVPLYRAMAKQGFDHWTEHLGPEDWQVWFYEAWETPDAAKKLEGPHSAPEPRLSTSPGTDVEEADGDLTLDVRGLEAPEPMVRTLAALEALPLDGTLIQVNERVPQFLLPRLAERGFAYEILEEGPDRVRIRIRRSGPHRGGDRSSPDEMQHREGDASSPNET